MKRILILLAALSSVVLAGCGQQIPDYVPTNTEAKQQSNLVPNPLKVQCSIAGDLYRCENSEVVCYRKWMMDSDGMQCKWK